MPLDLTQPSHLDELYQLADQYRENPSSSPSSLLSLEQQQSQNPDASLRQRVALKLARSKAIIQQQFPAGQTFFISILFAVYKEHQRILSSEQHPHGEDFLNRKIHQLHWLFDGSPQIKWKLIIIDDGCPDHSGQIARDILQENDHNEVAEVLFLQQAIDEKLPVVAGLSSPADSQKGGAILYGMWHAAQTSHADNTTHLILYTDADLSTHLGQCGLLLEPFLNPKTQCSIGSRREPSSVVVKKGKRNARGKLFIYLWKRLLPPLEKIIDTQCAFKAFRADLVKEIIQNNIEKKFAFDIELLLKTEQTHPASTQVIPLAWIDSEAASTTTDLEPYLPMLQSIVRMYRHYLPTNDKAEPFAQLIESLSQENWQELANEVPAEIADCEPAKLGDTELVPADQLLSN